ncbi:hypothetical protein [Bremerella cremea]|uniref:hypothetical protein n=1 Tax=Bremerella cremea TaxID=1031537 RepID=UPI0031F0CC65
MRNRTAWWMGIGSLVLVSFLANWASAEADSASNERSVQPGTLLKMARERLSEITSGDVASEQAGSDTEPQTIVFLALTRPTLPALMGIGHAKSVEKAVVAAADDLRSKATFAELAAGRLRIDIATTETDPAKIDNPHPLRVAALPYGPWFAKDSVLFMPAGFLDGAGDEDAESLTSGVRPYDYQSWIEAEDGSPVELYFGNRRKLGTSPEELMAAAEAGGDFLMRHMKLNGMFDYSYEPELNRNNDDYNLLRHAGTCIAMLELQKAVNDESMRTTGKLPESQIFLEGARRAIDYLRKNHTSGPLEKDKAADFLAIVEPDEGAKLGGAALMVLSLLREYEVTGDEQILDEARAYARFLVFLQEPDGHFISQYYYGEPDLFPHESIYYPGEAILALARLAKVDPKGPWLETAKRGTNWLIDVRDADKSDADLPHDHWLLMGLEEMAPQTDEPKFLKHAQRIANSICALQKKEAAYDDWIGSFYDPPRSTPTGCRAEAMAAMIRLAKFKQLDTDEYLAALKRMASFQQRCQVTPDNAIFLPCPEQAWGGFRRGLEEWEVRIDYIQHNMSGLLGLRGILVDSSNE